MLVKFCGLETGLFLNFFWVTMNKKRKGIGGDGRKIIFKLRKSGKTYREIGVMVCRVESSIRYVIKAFKIIGIITSKPRSGRPKLLTDGETRKVISLVQRNQRITSEQIAEDVK